MPDLHLALVKKFIYNSVSVYNSNPYTLFALNSFLFTTNKYIRNRK